MCLGGKRMRKIIFSLALLLLLTACNNADQTEQIQKNKEEVKLEQTSDKKYLANDKEIYDKITNLISQLHEHLQNIELPIASPSISLESISMAGYSEQSGFTLRGHFLYHSSSGSIGKFTISVEEYTKETFDFYIENGFKAISNYPDDYIFLDKQNGYEMLYIKDDYIYRFISDTVFGRQSANLLFPEDLIYISQEMHFESDFKRFFKIDTRYVNIPFYFPNSESETFYVIVDYFHTENDGESFNPQQQRVLIANDTMYFEQEQLALGETKINKEDVERFQLKPITIENVTAYFDEYMEPYPTVFEHSGKYYYLRPKQEVDQTTGKVYTILPDNWEDEIRKVMMSLFYGKVKEKADQEKLAKTVKSDFLDDHFYPFNIGLEFNQSQVESVLGTATYKGPVTEGYGNFVLDYDNPKVHINFYTPKIITISGEMSKEEFDEMILADFDGKKLKATYDDTKYLFYESTQQLFVFNEVNGKIDFFLTEADDNFYYWYENDGIVEDK